MQSTAKASALVKTIASFNVLRINPMTAATKICCTISVTAELTK